MNVKKGGFQQLDIQLEIIDLLFHKISIIIAAFISETIHDLRTETCIMQYSFARVIKMDTFCINHLGLLIFSSFYFIFTKKCIFMNKEEKNIKNQQLLKKMCLTHIGSLTSDQARYIISNNNMLPQMYVCDVLFV